MNTLTETIGDLSQPEKILDFASMSGVVAELRDEGSRVVLAQGVFDIVHLGHVRYLQAAAADGDVVVVGVENDASVKLNKGASRPWNSAEDRLAMLAEWVSCGLVFAYPDVPRYDRPDDFIGRYTELHPSSIAVATWDPHLGLKALQAAQAGTVITPIDYRYENSTTAMMKHLGYRE